MSVASKAGKLSTCLYNLLRHPRECIRRLSLPAVNPGKDLADQWQKSSRKADIQPTVADPLRAYFDSHSEGPGIWKWLHYFEIYHRHLSKFVGKPVTLAEVGIYSGGSLQMWHHYLGDQCHVHGIDIMPECTSYESPKTTIHIGDQSDRSFWDAFRRKVPSLDILIDDGGHEPDQQIITLEETLSYLNDGGIFICEDIHGIDNRFATYVHDMADRLNAMTKLPTPDLRSAVTPFQSSIASVHFYPYLIVIEKGRSLENGLQAPKHGTQWQPFTMRDAAKQASS